MNHTDQPPITSHDERLHRQFTVPNESSDQHFLAAPQESKPFHYRQPPLSVRMFKGVSYVLMAIASVIGVISTWAFFFTSEPYRAAVYFSVAVGVCLISGFAGFLYYIGEAILDIRQMLAHNRGRR